MIHGRNPAPARTSAPDPVPAQLRLTGEDLILREWTESDLPAMTELFDDPEIAHWTPVASPFGETAARAAVARAAGYRLVDEPPIAAIGKGRSLTLRTWAHDRP